MNLAYVSGVAAAPALKPVLDQVGNCDQTTVIAHVYPGKKEKINVSVSKQKGKTEKKKEGSLTGSRPTDQKASPSRSEWIRGRSCWQEEIDRKEQEERQCSDPM